MKTLTINFSPSLIQYCEVNCMLPFDAHTHSRFSFDAEKTVTVEAMCRAALEKGITHLAITDHYDIGAVLDGIYSYDAYAAKAAIEHAQDKFEGQLTLSYGIELGSATAYPDEAETFLDKMRFESVVGSIHYMSGYEDFCDWDMRSLSDEDFSAAWFCYLAELTRLCELGMIDVLAHLTYPLRYYMLAGRTLNLTPSMDAIAELLRKVIDQGILLEVNTSGYRCKMGGPMPDAQILALYKDLGGRLLSVGSDAHRPEDIAADYDRTEQLLSSLGFGEIAFKRNKLIEIHRI